MNQSCGNKTSEPKADTDEHSWSCPSSGCEKQIFISGCQLYLLSLANCRETPNAELTGSGVFFWLLLAKVFWLLTGVICVRNLSLAFFPRVVRRWEDCGYWQTVPYILPFSVNVNEFKCLAGRKLLPVIKTCCVYSWVPFWGQENWTLMHRGLWIPPCVLKTIFEK